MPTPDPAASQPWWRRASEAIGWGGAIGLLGALFNFFYTNAQGRRIREADVNSTRFKEDFCAPVDAALKIIATIPDAVDAILAQQLASAARAAAIADLQRQDFDPSQVKIQEVLISSDTTKWVEGTDWASAFDEHFDQIYAAFNALANGATPANKLAPNANYLRQEIRNLKQSLTDKVHNEHRRIHSAPHRLTTALRRLWRWI